MNTSLLKKFINSFWDKHIIPSLIDYVKIPNKSPSFDPEWKSSGHMDKVLQLATVWIKEHLPKKYLLVKNFMKKIPSLLIQLKKNLVLKASCFFP